MQTDSKKNGFTLIELSIILIVIAFIIGGIILARTLIRTSEIRSIIADKEKIENAVYNFRQKYQQLPGDFNRAESYWGADATCPLTAANSVTKTATCNGDGDGRLDTPGWAACATEPTGFQQEPFRLWQHLANAGLYSGQFTGVHGAEDKSRYGLVGVNIPRSLKIKEVGYQIMNFNGVQPAGGAASASWFDARYYNVLFIGREDIASSCYEPVLPFLSSAEVFSLETKYDDGVPGTGKIRVLNTPVGAGEYGQPFCATNATTYSMSDNPRSCSLIWTLDW